MKVFDLFSKREKRKRGEYPDVYLYDEIPRELRVKIVHIIRDAFGTPLNLGGHGNQVWKAYESIHDALCREYGFLKLPGEYESCYEAVLNYLLQVEAAENAIDVIELSLRVIDNHVRENRHEYKDRKISPDDAIDELNHRFREHGVGYQYESGMIVRIDSQLIHSEVVQPTLNLLQDSKFKGANQEFLSAHEHYRNRKHKECLNDCLKAVESCLKAICKGRKWHYSEKDTAKRLLEIVFNHGLIPNFMQSHFSALRNTLESGVPTIRNRRGGHGQGSTIVPVPESIAAYALHLTASNILLLARADNEMK
ncbi:MAG: hypothetical protein OXR72_09920 [Gemmatimonadota bacterium]|nr:hypothetical protein [Gemmatimonadota bacterium]